MNITLDDCIAKAHECRERAVRATSEEAKAELLRLATEWLELAEELARRRDPLSPDSHAPAKAKNRVKQCLAHAELCRALAAQTIHASRKASLLQLASKWALMAEAG